MNARTELDIHRLIDGELAPDEAAAVAAWVEADPARREQAQAWRMQRDLLRARFDPLLNEGVPPTLANALATAAQAPQRAANDGRYRRVVGALALIAASGAAGWFGHAALSARPAAPDGFASLPARAAIAHRVYVPEVRHAVEVVAAEEEHLVRWLSRRLSTKVRAPSLLTHGFRLVGGRLLPGEDRPMAQFMYQNDAGRRLTLYVIALGAPDAARGTAFRYDKVGEVGVFYWSEDGRGYALSGDLSRAELLPVARTVYAELDEPRKGG